MDVHPPCLESSRVLLCQRILLIPASQRKSSRPCWGSSARSLGTSFRGLHLTGVVQLRRSPRALCRWAVQARRMTSGLRWGGRQESRPLAGNEFVVANRMVPHGELDHSVEDETSTARTPAVEAKDELVEVALQVRVLDGPLVSAE